MKNAQSPINSLESATENAFEHKLRRKILRLACEASVHGRERCQRWSRKNANPEKPHLESSAAEAPSQLHEWKFFDKKLHKFSVIVWITDWQCISAAIANLTHLARRLSSSFTQFSFEWRAARFMAKESSLRDMRQRAFENRSGEEFLNGFPTQQLPPGFALFVSRRYAIWMISSS